MNQLEGQLRRAARNTAEPRLASMLAAAPTGTQVLVLMKAILPNVERVLTASDRTDLRIAASLDFPAQGNQRRYVDGLASFLGQKPAPRAKPDTRRATRQPSIRDGQPTLHEEIRQILLSYRNRWMTTREIADEVNRRGCYRKRDGSDVTPYQIHGRTRKYPQLFERDGSRARLFDN